MPDEQGLRSFVSIAVRSPVVQDHALLWPRINESTYRMLQAMKEADWPQQYINVLFGFWITSVRMNGDTTRARQPAKR